MLIKCFPGRGDFKIANRQMLVVSYASLDKLQRTRLLQNAKIGSRRLQPASRTFYIYNALRNLKVATTINLRCKLSILQKSIQRSNRSISGILAQGNSDAAVRVKN